MVLAISVLRRLRPVGYVWFAFAGAAVAMVLVHAIAALGRDGATPVKLAIAGAALTAALASWTSGVLLTDRADDGGVPVLAGRHDRRPRASTCS